MTDIFEEVEERLREDKLQVFWRKYGAYVIAAAVGLVVVVGLSSAWTVWSTANNRSIGERFSALQQQAAIDPAGAEKALKEFQKNASGGYKALAEMERAGALEAQGDLAGALAAFDAAAGMAREPVLKQSAQLRAAYIAAESEPFAAIEARLKPVIDARGPFSYLARELLAVEAYEANQPERARRELAYLETAFEAPEGVRNRAASFLQVLGPAAPAPTAGSGEPASAPTPVESTGEKK
ncbi:MAG: tetratricopeptide repeat protein [Hyphomonadaceae bacterium]|nr:tetratricopeptide repeat protein [Hyphomonadaceae bacterium]